MRFVQFISALAVFCLLGSIAAAQPMGYPTGPLGTSGSASDDLVDLIGSTVAPTSWDTVGGPGSMAPFDSNLSLVVNQTQEVHEEIVDLLEQLRRMQDIQVTVEVPFRTISDSFFEKMGVGNWSGNIKGMPFSIGGGDLAIPQFGGYDPSAGAKTGISFRHGDSNVDFPNIMAAQGSRRSAVTQAPVVTMFNGQRAFFSDTSQSPFVISQIPVVGGCPLLPIPSMAYAYVPTRHRQIVLPAPRQENHRVAAMRRKWAEQEQKKRAGENEFFRRVEDPNRPRRIPVKAEKKAAPVRERAGDVNMAGPTRTAVARAPGQKLVASQESSAGRAVPSVAEARRMHETEQSQGNKEARVFYERGRAAEEDGKPHVAKIYYGMALKQAAGDFRNEILARLRAVTPTKSRE